MSHEQDDLEDEDVNTLCPVCNAVLGEGDDCDHVIANLGDDTIEVPIGQPDFLTEFETAVGDIASVIESLPKGKRQTLLGLIEKNANLEDYLREAWDSGEYSEYKIALYLGGLVSGCPSLVEVLDCESAGWGSCSSWNLYIATDRAKAHRGLLRVQKRDLGQLKRVLARAKKLAERPKKRKPK